MARTTRMLQVLVPALCVLTWRSARADETKAASDDRPAAEAARQAAWAGPAGQETVDAQTARLEALLQAQQNRIRSLEQQAAVVAPQDQEAARLEVMRQQIREILNEAEFRERLMSPGVTAGYDKGFYIRSSDEKFSFKTTGRVQFRWTHYATRAENRYLSAGLQRNDRTGFDMKRLRLTFSGNVYDKDLTYLIEAMADSPIGYELRILWAWVNYRFCDPFQIRAGVMQLAGTRASFQSSAGMQFPEYPTSDFIFTTGTGLGVRFWGQLFDKRLDYYLDVVNALNGPTGRVITNDPAELDSNPAIAFRAVWHALGENKTDPAAEWASWGDIEIHQTPALDLAFGYVFNDDQGDLRTSRIIFAHPRSPWAGGFGVTTSNGLQINQFLWDAAFKYMGFSLSGEYTLQIIDPRRAYRAPFTPLTLLTGETSTVVNHGAYVQTGYFLPIPGFEKKLEVVGRVGGVSTNAGGTEGTWFYAGGLNYYIEGNKVKLQFDAERISEVPLSANGVTVSANDDATIFRVQLQFAF